MGSGPNSPLGFAIHVAASPHAPFKNLRARFRMLKILKSVRTQPLDWAMGDRSPKSVQKQATQKQAKNKATNQQKRQAVAAKQTGNNPKRGK
jgi:hypothetical protein